MFGACNDPRLLSIQSINPTHFASSCLAVPFLLDWWAVTMKTHTRNCSLRSLELKKSHDYVSVNHVRVTTRVKVNYSNEVIRCIPCGIGYF